MATSELPSLIRAVHGALAGAGVNGAVEPEKPKLAPAAWRPEAERRQSRFAELARSTRIVRPPLNGV